MSDEFQPDKIVGTTTVVRRRTMAKFVSPPPDNELPAGQAWRFQRSIDGGYWYIQDLGEERSKEEAIESLRNHKSRIYEYDE